MTCSSFNVRCIGKVCMSTTSLPFYVHDLHFWQFREACREHHLLKSEGVVGSAFLYRSSCFCADVTELGDDEYSLVHNARMSGLTSCYAIYLHSSEHDDGYLLEFFLPVNMKDDSDIQNLVKMIKMRCKFSFLEFGDLLSTNVIGKSMEARQSSLTMRLIDISQSSLSNETMQLDSKDPQSVVETNAQIDCINAQYQCDFSNSYSKNRISDIMSINRMSVDDVTSTKVDVVIGDTRGCTKQRRKRKMDPVTLDTIQQYYGKPICEASWGLGARWWICGKHNASVCESNPHVNISPKRQTTRGSVSKVTEASDGSIGSPKKIKRVVNLSDTRIVIVKAVFRGDIIKFQFPISSGVLELKKQVAQRIGLKSAKFVLKYRDEDDDLILVSCDADLRSLMPFSASSVRYTIKLIVEMVDD